MPSTSKAQQKLMGMAYALKKGEMDPEDASQEVKDLANSMTLNQLKDFAETKHEGLPDKVEEENISPSSVGGMGGVKFPTSTNTGSGDVPAGRGDAEEEYKNKKGKMKHLKTFESFVNEAQVNNYYSFESLADFRKAEGALIKAGFYRSGNGYPPTGDEPSSYKPDKHWKVIRVYRGQEEAAKLLKKAKLDKGGEYKKPMDYIIFNQGGYLD